MTFRRSQCFIFVPSKWPLYEANGRHLTAIPAGHLLLRHVTLAPCQCLLLSIWKTLTTLHRKSLQFLKALSHGTTLDTIGFF